jgi:hypothetical protein
METRLVGYATLTHPTRTGGGWTTSLPLVRLSVHRETDDKSIHKGTRPFEDFSI